MEYLGDILIINILPEIWILGELDFLQKFGLCVENYDYLGKIRIIWGKLGLFGEN